MPGEFAWADGNVVISKKRVISGPFADHGSATKVKPVNRSDKSRREGSRKKSSHEMLEKKRRTTIRRKGR